MYAVNKNNSVVWRLMAILLTESLSLYRCYDIEEPIMSVNVSRTRNNECPNADAVTTMICYSESIILSCGLIAYVKICLVS